MVVVVSPADNHGETDLSFPFFHHCQIYILPSAGSNRHSRYIYSIYKSRLENAWWSTRLLYTYKWIGRASQRKRRKDISNNTYNITTTSMHHVISWLKVQLQPNAIPYGEQSTVPSHHHNFCLYIVHEPWTGRHYSVYIFTPHCINIVHL